MQQLIYRQHITVNIDTSNSLHAINYRGKNDDYVWLNDHESYIPWRDTQRNEIFIEMHYVITEKKYMIWYMSITCQGITLNPEQGPLPTYNNTSNMPSSLKYHK